MNGQALKKSSTEPASSLPLAPTPSVRREMLQSIMLHCVRALSFGVSALLFLPHTLYLPVVRGRDAHWQAALHYYFEHDFTFGKDIVFTYGPLGVLSARMAFESTRLLLVSWDLVSYALVLAACALCCWRLQRVAELLVLVLIAFTVNAYRYPLDAAILLFALYFFFTAAFLHTKRASFAVVATSLSLLLFFTKLSFVLVMLVVQSLLLLHLLHTQPAKKKVLLYSSVYCLSLFALCQYFRVDISGYLLGALHYVAEYSDVMYQRIDGNKDNLTKALSVLACMLVAIALQLRYFYRRHAECLIVLLACAYFAVLYKQGFVRGDWVHILQFFQYLPLGLGIWYVFSAPQIRQMLAPALLLALLFGFSYRKQAYSYEQISQRLQGFERYIEAAFTPLARRHPDPGVFQSPIPKTMRSRIADATVDIFPFQIYQLSLQGYRYWPRPVPQTYASYNHYLDSLNAAHFNSRSAPTFVLYSYGSLDLRHVFFDEPQTRIALMRHYDVVEKDSVWLLLKRRNTPRALETRPLALKPSTNIETQSVALDQPFTPPTSEHFVYLHAECEYSLIGRILRSIYKAPPLSIHVRLKDGRNGTHRAIKPLLSTGVLADPFIASVDDAAHFFSADARALPSVQSMHFGSPWPSGFSGVCTLRWEELKAVQQP